MNIAIAIVNYTIKIKILQSQYYWQLNSFAFFQCMCKFYVYVCGKYLKNEIKSWKK